MQIYPSTRLRWEWLRRTDPGAPWAALPAPADREVHDRFQDSVRIVLGDGGDALFWLDNWLPAGPIKEFAPALFQAVRPMRRKRTVRDALLDHTWVRDIGGGLSATALAEYASLWDMLLDVQLDHSTPDRFVWKWSASGVFSCASAYASMFDGTAPLIGAKEIWKTSAPPKVRFFMWLLLHGRLWTAHRRWRHGLQPAATCVLCEQEDESQEHLFVACAITRELWFRILSWAGAQQLAPPPGGSTGVIVWWMDTRLRVPSSRRGAFDSLVLLVSWEVWKERNRRTFDGNCLSLSQLLQRIKDEGEEWIGAGFGKLAALFVGI